MSSLSILPPSYAFVEIWVVRLFLLLGTITIGPWALLLIYDGAWYIIRTILYEIPIVGGRARDRARRQAHSSTKDPYRKLGNHNTNLRKSSPYSNIEVNSAKNLKIRLSEGLCAKI